MRGQRIPHQQGSHIDYIMGQPKENGEGDSQCGNKQ
jgi:hypothetical protein